MDWKAKLLGQKLLDILPHELGLRLHFVMQRKFGNIGQMTSERRFTSLKRGVDVAKYLQKQINCNFEGYKIVEVGTGWLGSDILLFYMLGASELYTCDILRHLNESLVLDTLQTIGDNLDFISKECNLDFAFLEERYSQISSGKNLADILASANIKYLAPVKFHEVDFPPSYFDLFYSQSVLQRVPPEDLTAYLKTARLALKPSGYSCHIIHHSDHNARHDDTLDVLSYLRYSDRVYDFLQSKKFNYQNRMRHSEFLQLFKANGFENIAEETIAIEHKSSDDLCLAPRFKSIPLDDLLITRTQLVSKPV